MKCKFNVIYEISMISLGPFAALSAAVHCMINLFGACSALQPIMENSDDVIKGLKAD